MQHYREVFGRVVGETADVDSADDDAYPADRDVATESTARRTGSSTRRRS
jgi:hypothetical protein